MERHNKLISYEGEDYDLRHLHPKNLKKVLPCGTVIPIFIMFSSHCYTDSDAPEGREHLEVKDRNGNLRFFCTKRYQLSMRLTEWFLSWSQETCFHSKDKKRGAENWIVVEEENGDKIKIAFSITPNNRNPKGVFIRVKSVHAYEWSSPPEHPHPHIPYGVLVKGLGLNREIPAIRERSPQKKEGA